MLITIGTHVTICTMVHHTKGQHYELTQSMSRENSKQIDRQLSKD